MNIFERMFSGNTFKTKYPLLDKYVTDSTIRENLVKNQEFNKKYINNEFLIEAFVKELDRHFDKDTAYKIIKESIFFMPEITLQSFITSYLNSNEVTKANADVLKFYKTNSQYGIESTKYIEANGIITNRSFKEVPAKILNDKFRNLNTKDYSFGETKLNDIYESLSYQEKSLLISIMENNTFEIFNDIYDTRLEKFNIETHFNLKTLLNLLINCEVDTAILNKEVISNIGEDNILFLSYSLFNMNYGASASRIIKHYISNKKFDLIIALINKGLINKLENFTIENVKNVEDEDLIKVLSKKINNMEYSYDNKNVA